MLDAVLGIRGMHSAYLAARNLENRNDDFD